jgi:hypothetical protein
MTQYQNLNGSKLDWEPLYNRVQQLEGKRLPSYIGNLKTALINHVGLSQDAHGEAAYQLAVEISRLTTYCDPEIIYWFSRLMELIDSQ